MMLRNAARILVILSATAVIAQSTPPTPTAAGDAVATGPRRASAGQTIASLGAQRSSGVPAQVPLRQRVEDLEKTINQMHSVLKRMQVRAAKSSVKDSFANTNLDMWELMMGHLDTELQDLQLAVAAREDMEARRAALYKQADEKIEARAQAARAAQVAKFNAKAQTSETAAQGSGQSPAEQTVSGQSSTVPATNVPSPN